MHKKRALKIGAFALIGTALALAAACGSNGPSSSEYDKVKQELQDQQTANQQLQVQLATTLKGAAAPAGGTAAAAPAASGSAAAPAASSGAKTILASQAVTPGPPPPTPTPLPAGVTPPPKPTPPASYYQPVGPYFIYVETIATATASKYNIASTLACTPSGAFNRGQRIVFRYDIVDMATGKRLTDQDASSTTVQLVMANGDTSKGTWSQRGGGHVAGAPYMFSSTWDIPLDYPLGGVDYKIVITKDGKSFTWSPPYLAAPDGSEDTRPKVVG